MAIDKSRGICCSDAFLQTSGGRLCSEYILVSLLRNAGKVIIPRQSRGLEMLGRSKRPFQQNIGFVWAPAHHSECRRLYLRNMHLRTHADYAAQVAIVGDHLCTLRLPYQEMSYARKERHAGIGRALRRRASSVPVAMGGNTGSGLLLLIAFSPLVLSGSLVPDRRH